MAGRKRHWGRFATTEILLAAGGRLVIQMLSLVETELGRELVDTTFVRITGQLTVRTAGLSVVPVPYAAGIAVLEEGTLADPEIDDADWMWYVQRHTNTARTASEFGWDEVTWDNRSARKMGGSRRRLLLIITNIHASESIRVSTAGRVLILD